MNGTFMYVTTGPGSILFTALQDIYRTYRTPIPVNERVLVLEYRVPVLIANVSTTYKGHIFPPITDD